MFGILFRKYENLAYAHSVCLILNVQSDTLPVLGSPMAVSIPGVGGLRYFHIYVGS